MIVPTGVTLTEYCDAIKAGNKSHVRITFPVQNITFTDDDISSEGGITISTDSNPSVDMQYNSSVCSEIVISFLNNSKFDGFDWTEEFSVEFGIEIGNDTYWVTVGYFTGTKPKRYINSEIIEFVAYDRMHLFDFVADDIIATLDFGSGTVKINTILNAITNSVGISYVPVGSSDNYTISVNPFDKGITCRDVFAIIAEANGQFAYIDETGSLSYTDYGDHNFGTPYNIYSYDYFNANIADSLTGSLDGVVFIDTNDPSNNSSYPTGATGNLCYIINNPILKNLSANYRDAKLLGIYNRMTKFGEGGTNGTYYPCTVETKGNWLVKVGDLLRLSYYDYHTKTYGFTFLPVFSRTLTWNGSCIDTYENTGNMLREVPSEYEYESLTENNVANDLTTTDPGYVLDARQGKALKDQLGSLQVVETVLVSNSTTFTLEPYTSYILFGVSGNSTHQGLWVIIGFDTGSQVRTIQAGSAVTVSASGSVITVSHSASRNTRYTLIKCGVFTS